jgi:hypothetical protein
VSDEHTKLAAGLRQARKATKETPWWFAFVPKGNNDGMFLVAKMKIPTKEVDNARTACGAMHAYQGRCFGEGDQLICEVAKEAPATLATQVKAVVHRDAEIQLKVEFRVAADLAHEQAGAGAPTGSAPGAAPAPPASAPAPRKDIAAAQAIWQAARESVIAELHKMAADLVSDPGPDTREAIILINALVKNLSPRLETAQQVQEMENFITGDDVIADACMACDVRTPLLRAITAVKAALPK